MSNILQRYKILIADSDKVIAKVLKNMLEGMGFSNIEVVQNELKAIQLLKKEPIDFLITEWNVDQTGNHTLINHIRHDPLSPNPTLPIIMLTGRAEQTDVITARDLGINEYVIKPFSATSMYKRLERLVEYPRDFVVASNFVGPERRSKKPLPPDVSDRRTLHIAPQNKRFVPGNALGDTATPKIWSADYSLKQKLGINTTLSSIITPAVLNKAQMAIQSITSEPLQWIKENMDQLMAAHDALNKDPVNYRRNSLKMSEAALAISSRAGTFGYHSASKVAYMLSLFCRNRLENPNQIHSVIAEKHIEVIQVTLSDKLRNAATAQHNEIIKELENLVEKYTY